MAAAGVTTIAELKAKINTDAEAASAQATEALKKQVSDLEIIKATQGNEKGALKTELDGVKAKLAEFESKKPEDVKPPDDKVVDWKQENTIREKAFTAEDWDKVDEALKAAPTVAQELATKTEEGRAAFYAETLGSKPQAEQGTFRRPQPKEKLTIAQQVALALGKDTGGRVPVRRPSGVGSPKPNQNKKPADLSMANSPSLRDRIKALS